MRVLPPAPRPHEPTQIDWYVLGAWLLMAGSWIAILGTAAWFVKTLLSWVRP